jgi:ubiquinone/menaquinone biosynthesis C-methylase UbiE
MQPQKSPSPEIIFELINSYQKSAALKGAIDLELFTAIGEGNTTVKALAERTRASERGIRILADYLTVAGLLSKSGTGYALTPDSATFLDKRSPAYIGSIGQFMMSPDVMKGFTDIAATVRKGGTIVPNEGTIGVENPIWVDFARGMAPMMMPAAQAIPEIAGAAGGQPWKVLDIAAGHGLFGIMMAARNPAARVVALDWPKVLNVAEENAKKFGVADRWTKLPGDALAVDFGSDYDVVLLTNFLHHFDAPTCERILTKVHAALKPGGRVLTLEFVPNEDRVSPPVAAQFPMVMLAGTPSGDAYTFAEFETMFRNAGFRRSEIQPLAGLPQHVIVSYA